MCLSQFARQFSRDEPLTFDWVCRHVSWPLPPPKNIKDLVHLEAVHDVLDLYLWLRYFHISISLSQVLLMNACHPNSWCCLMPVSSYRFMDMFPDTAPVREIQRQLDDVIEEGVQNITRLIRATEPALANLQTQSNRGLTHGSSGTDSSSFKTRRRGPREEKGSAEMMNSPLASRLVRDGLLTPDLLQQLQREWSKDRVATEQQDKGKRKKKKT